MTTDFLAPVVSLPDEFTTAALGARLADVIAAGFVDSPDQAPDGFTIHLCGALGAGKTTVVRALLKRLGVEGRIKSPTYTLVEPYVVDLQKTFESRQRVNLYCYHFDFYRFEDPHDWLDAGFRDYFSDAALRLVEWPERAILAGDSLLPPADLRVTLEADGDGRIARLDTPTSLGAAWLTRAPRADRPADAS